MAINNRSKITMHVLPIKSSLIRFPLSSNDLQKEIECEYSSITETGHRGCYDTDIIGQGPSKNNRKP